MAARLDSYQKVFTALAHPARRRVLLAVYLNGGSMTAGEIASMFAHAWQTTTKHLQVLERAGLLRHERSGRNRIYHLDRKRLALVNEWLSTFATQSSSNRERRTASSANARRRAARARAAGRTRPSAPPEG